MYSICFSTWKLKKKEFFLKTTWTICDSKKLSKKATFLTLKPYFNTSVIQKNNKKQHNISLFLYFCKIYFCIFVF